MGCIRSTNNLKRLVGEGVGMEGLSSSLLLLLLSWTRNRARIRTSGHLVTGCCDSWLSDYWRGMSLMLVLLRAYCLINATTRCQTACRLSLGDSTLSSLPFPTHFLRNTMSTIGCTFQSKCGVTSPTSRLKCSDPLMQRPYSFHR